MSATARSAALVLTLCLVSCTDDPTADPVTAPTPSLAAGGVVRATGSGTHLRVGTEGEELTTFAFSAVRGPDGGATGQWEYRFRVAGFRVHGRVTCLSVAGNQAWIGGVVEKVVTDDPAFESLLGLEMWWRSVDNGEGRGAAPDVTTGLGFGFEGVPITAESWCRDQPLTLVARDVATGNIQIVGE
ncbi:MAG TPA: hypothetical protein VEB59_13205 [Gemmatimonadales bacterium]|nr:hypothetical protein [Gemmatimonadales bacterium]